MRLIKNPTTDQIRSFLQSAGSSLKTFRYFDKRDVSIIQNHIFTALYESDDQFVGYGHLDKEDDVVWLGICLRPDQIGKGLSKTIMNDIILFAKSNNIDEVNLSVDADNVRAISLYEKFGFQTVNNSSKVKLMKARI